ncbi:MAG TPA: response regulator transcription factor [Candidatus Acidoferrales bacterium]|nr:response regulator transcription factor [Candidatus Acidoferrales bacterium]
MSPAARPPRARILVVEDEARLRALLRLYLERAGYEVREAGDGRAALDAFDEDPADLLVVDLMLPKLQGEALITAIREDSQVPILITSAKRSDVERIAGLRLGADDYLPKPFNVHELVERVNAILRRTGTGAGSGEAGIPAIGGTGVRMAGGAASRREAPGHLSFAGGRLVFEPPTRAYTCGDESGRLTPAEARLLLALVRAGGSPLDRDQLLQAVAGPHAETSRNVDVHVGNLRRKLGDDPAKPWAIETIPDVGYRWLAPVDPAEDPDRPAGPGRPGTSDRSAGTGRGSPAAADPSVVRPARREHAKA